MSKSRKIILAVVAVAIVGLLAFAFVSDGALATAPCVDCGGAGLVEEAACETCGGEGTVDDLICADCVNLDGKCPSCEGEGTVAAESKYSETFVALLPPVIAIALALITKEVFSSLFVGVVVGDGGFFGTRFHAVAVGGE